MKPVLNALQAFINPFPQQGPALFRSQRNRRALVLACAACVPLVIALALFDLSVAAIAVGVLAFLLLSAINLATRNITGSVDGRMDERERHMRDHAHRIAYWMLTLLIGLLAGGVWGAQTGSAEAGKPNPLLTLHQLQYAALTIAFGVLSSGLPAMVYAWVEADPIGEDDGNA